MIPAQKQVVWGGLKNTASPDPGKVFPEMSSTFSPRIAHLIWAKYLILWISPYFRILLGMPIGYHRIHVMIYLPTNHNDYPNVYIVLYLHTIHESYEIVNPDIQWWIPRRLKHSADFGLGKHVSSPKALAQCKAFELDGWPVLFANV